MTRYAAAYLRRSVVSDSNPGDASEAAQTQAVQDMCGPNVSLFRDWGISGLKNNRPDYQRLRAEIAADRVESVCAYSLSRLGRSARELLDFVALCQQHGVSIRTKAEGLDTSTAAGRAFLGIMAVLAELEAELARERTVASIGALRAKGHNLARPGVGYVAERDAKGIRVLVQDGSADTIIRTYEEARTFEGTARLLTERKVPTHAEVQKQRRAEANGETYVPQPKVWSTSVVRRTLAKIAPELLPPTPLGRSRVLHGSGLWGQLVRCPECEQTLTPNYARRQLFCARARRMPHAKGSVMFTKVRPFIEQQAGLYQPNGIAIRGGGNDAERDALTERKTRVGDRYEAGEMSPETFRQRIADIDAQLAALASSDQALAAIIPTPVGVDWTQNDQQVGDQLRLIWSHVELNPDWTPKQVVWRVPDYLHDADARDKYIAEQDADVAAAQKQGA